MANGVVILTKVKSVYNGNIYSTQTNVAVDNGSIGVLGDYKAGEREIRNLVKPTTANIKTNGVVLVASPEIVYDETRTSSNALQNFINEADVPMRAYEIAPHDEFEISANMITALASAPVVGNYVVATNDSFKYTESASLPLAADNCFVAKILYKRNLNTITAVTSSGATSIVMYGLEVIRNTNN